MQKLNTKISGVANKFDIEDIEPLRIPEEECVFNEDHDKDVKEDYKYIRKKLKKCVGACEVVLEQALRDIQKNPGPRTVEGCSALIKTMIEASKELQNVQEKHKKLFKNDNKPEEETEEQPGKKKFRGNLNDIIEELDKEDDSSIDKT